MISGVSLKGIDAVLVLLQPSPGGGHTPATLGVKGSYNRLGSIDFIEEDLHTELVSAWCADRLRDGRLTLDGPAPDNLEQLLKYFERNLSDSSERHPAAALDGRRLFCALISRPIWDGLAALPPDGDGFPGVFQEIYAGHLADLTEQAGELLAVNDFLASRGLAWAPQDARTLGEQHYVQEIEELLATARRGFATEPVVLAALDIYAEEIEDLIADD